MCAKPFYRLDRLESDSCYHPSVTRPRVILLHIFCYVSSLKLDNDLSVGYYAYALPYVFRAVRAHHGMQKREVGNAVFALRHIHLCKMHFLATKLVYFFRNFRNQKQGSSFEVPSGAVAGMLPQDTGRIVFLPKLVRPETRGIMGACTGYADFTAPHIYSSPLFQRLLRARNTRLRL